MTRKSTRPLNLSELQLRVLRQFRLIYGSVRQHFREVEKRCGISGSQMWLLREIAANPGIGVSSLAGRLAIHQSTASVLVEKLVSAGLITKTRSMEDQRRVGLAVTPSGRQLLKNAPGPVEGVLPEAIESLPEGSLHNLHASLGELIGGLVAHNERDAEKPLADL